MADHQWRHGRRHGSTWWGGRARRVRPGSAQARHPAHLPRSLPRALGAQAPDRTRQVIAFGGDGCLTMLLGDLMTAVDDGLKSSSSSSTTADSPWRSWRWNRWASRVRHPTPEPGPGRGRPLDGVPRGARRGPGRCRRVRRGCARP
ncbi:MAG: thiamine pyrophosphate-dependent enzyme [Ornithinibacter sp.]